MADVNTVITAANALFIAVTGVKKTFLYAPDSPPSADLPCVIPIWSRLDHSAQANGYQKKAYTVKFVLIVSPYNHKLSTIDEEMRPYGDRVMDLFFQHGRLNDPTIDNAFMTDGEPGHIAYNSEVVNYIGWNFTLAATLKQELEQGN